MNSFDILYIIVFQFTKIHYKLNKKCSSAHCMCVECGLRKYSQKRKNKTRPAFVLPQTDLMTWIVVTHAIQIKGG